MLIFSNHDLYVGVIIAYNLLAAFLHFFLLDKMGLLRVPVQAEIQGLDIIKHNEPAYGFGIDDTDEILMMKSASDYSIPPQNVISVAPYNNSDIKQKY